MAQFGQTFYTAQLPKENTREALPAGEYIAVLRKAELKTNDKGNQYINCQFKVVDGQHKGGVFFDIINIANSSEQAVEIGLARLNTLLTIGGLSGCGSTEELEHAGIHILAVLGVKEYNGNKKNELIVMKNPNEQQRLPQQTMQPITQQSYVAQQPIAQPVYQQQPQAQPVQNWQQPQSPVQQPQVQQWQSQPQQPVAPTIQSTQEMLSDSIPF